MEMHDQYAQMADKPALIPIDWDGEAITARA